MELIPEISIFQKSGKTPQCHPDDPAKTALKGVPLRRVAKDQFLVNLKFNTRQRSLHFPTRAFFCTVVLGELMGLDHGLQGSQLIRKPLNNGSRFSDVSSLSRM